MIVYINKTKSTYWYPKNMANKIKTIFFICVFFTVIQFVKAGENKPNIILVFTDDLGIEALKTYGGHSTNTPNIDKLATQGMVFTHCFANPAC